jgi:hypothetical protein
MCGGKMVHQPEKDRVHWIHPEMHGQLMQSNWKPAQDCMLAGTRRTSLLIQMLRLWMTKTKIAFN